MCSICPQRKEKSIATREPLTGITESVHFESRTSERKQTKSLDGSESRLADT